MIDSDPTRLGSTLRRRRITAGLTLREVAERTGMTISTISRLEVGEIETPKPEHLQRLARALDIEIEELYGEAGYLIPENLPELAPYLRSKYGLPDQAVAALDEYFQAMRGRWETSTKEGEHDQGDNNKP
jgi:transcriptional regulator with XRE-family HTH domain